MSATPAHFCTNSEETVHSFWQSKRLRNLTVGRLLWPYYTELMAAPPGQPKTRHVPLPPRPVPTVASESPCPRSRICGSVRVSPSGRQVRWAGRKAAGLPSSQNGHRTRDGKEKDLLQNEDLTCASRRTLESNQSCSWSNARRFFWCSLELFLLLHISQLIYF